MYTLEISNYHWYASTTHIDKCLRARHDSQIPSHAVANDVDPRVDVSHSDLDVDVAVEALVVPTEVESHEINRVGGA